MRQFAALFAALDQTTSTNQKVEAMARYFKNAPPGDAAWAIFFLTGRRLKRLLPWAAIGEWTLAATGFERWMLEDCWSVVGDARSTNNGFVSVTLSATGAGKFFRRPPQQLGCAAGRDSVPLVA